uniref:Uncharacterized protein n=1 Tax=Arundo donax TaxID=35708 RepID=A0A0A8YZ27_ARUDO
MRGYSSLVARRLNEQHEDSTQVGQSSFISSSNILMEDKLSKKNL